MRLVLLTAVLAVPKVQASISSHNSTACSFLTNLRLGNGTIITLATSISAGSNFTGNSTETSYNTLQTNLPSICRVAFTVRTSPKSTANAEVWLPQPSLWNDRFLAVGNGGFAGGINYPDIVWGARKGFATMSTSTGHDSTQSDGTWMLDNPEAMIDFGHRALHVTTGVAKSIVEAYYGEHEGYAYYAGCSTGMSKPQTFRTCSCSQAYVLQVAGKGSTQRNATPRTTMAFLWDLLFPRRPILPHGKSTSRLSNFQTIDLPIFQRVCGLPFTRQCWTSAMGWTAFSTLR